MSASNSSVSSSAPSVVLGLALMAHCTLFHLFFTKYYLDKDTVTTVVHTHGPAIATNVSMVVLVVLCCFQCSYCPCV
jgi:hypothetical protein